MICPWLKCKSITTEVSPSPLGVTTETTKTYERETFNACHGEECPYYVFNAKGHMLQTSCLRVLFENENYHKET